MVSDCPENWRRCIRQIMLVTVALMLILFIGGCNAKSAPSAQDTSAKSIKERRPLLYDRELSQVIVYYLTEDGRYLVPITVTFNPTREATKVAIEKLLAGPQGCSLTSVIPEGVKLREVYGVNSRQVVYVDLTKDFLQIDNQQQAELALKALVMTVTELNNSQGVQLLIEGKKVSEIAGIKADEPLKRPPYINSLLDNEEQKGVQVYFSDEKVLYLVPVTVALPAGSSENNLPEAALTALLLGPPQESGLIRTIWPETRLLDLKINQGLATVDLSKEAIGYGGGTTAEGFLVGSLLHTLTQFDEIYKVQMLIESQEKDYLPEGTAIDQPLEQPEQINFCY